MNKQRTWRHYVADIRNYVARDRDEWEIAAAPAADYIAWVEASAVLRTLVADGLAGYMRAVLADLALRDAILDSVGHALERAGYPVRNGSAVARARLSEAAKLEEVARLLANMGHPDLA